MGEVKDSSKEFDKKTLKIKAELKTKEHVTNIHSICWEECEAAEGQTAKELVSADSTKVLVWDLKTGKDKLIYDIQKLKSNESDLAECTVVKRDPHHK
jgi:hypothetical protein